MTVHLVAITNFILNFQSIFILIDTAQCIHVSELYKGSFTPNICTIGNQAL